MALNSIVRTNITAVNAHRQLSGAGLQQTKSSERLSSGKRINSAADDVAGMGIAQKMRAQIVGLDRASLNAQDAMSLVQTAEGSLSSVNEMLIRVRELVVQAANDTNAHDPNNLIQSDRRSLQDEIDQIMMEINNVAYRTEFNTRRLLDGSNHNEGVLHGQHHSVQLVQLNAPARISSLDQFLLEPANPPFVGSLEELLVRIGANLHDMAPADWIALHGGVAFEGIEQALDAAMNAEFDDVTGEPIPGTGLWSDLEIRAGLTFSSAYELLDAFIIGLHNPNVLRAGDIGWNEAPQPFEGWTHFTDLANGAEPRLNASTFARAQSTSGGVPIYQALRQVGFAGLTSESTFSDVRHVFNRMDYSPAGGWAHGFGPPGSGYTDNIADALTEAGWLDTRGMSWEDFVNQYLTGNSEIVEHQIWAPNEFERERGMHLWFHTGAGSGQGLLVGIQSMGTRTLGQPVGDLMDMIDVESASGRPISDQIDYVDNALTHVNRQRSQLGAVYNRLEFARMGLDVSSENLTASMSHIRDADMAKELMGLYSSNVLTQAATTMMAHANQAPQAVLELLQA